MPTRSRTYICPPDHAHGESSTCYNHHKCGCSDCRAYVAALQWRRVQYAKQGRRTLRRVPLEEVRPHVQKLQEFGIGWKRLAELSGVNSITVQALCFGASTPPSRPYGRKSITVENAQRILAVQPVRENLAPGTPVDARGVRRRIQALFAIGWGGPVLARELDIPLEEVRRMTSAPRVTRARAERVEAVYERLSMTPAPESTPAERYARRRALAAAERHGWVPPLAWDDIDRQDEPARSPLPGEMTEQIADDLVSAWHKRGERGEGINQRADLIEGLRSLGVSWREISSRLGPSIGVLSASLSAVRKRAAQPLSWQA